MNIPIDGFAEIHPDVVAGVAVAAGAWVGAWLARGVRPRPGETVAFAGGLVTLLAVLNGPLHALSDRYLFSAHMVQDLALTPILVPLLLVRGVVEGQRGLRRADRRAGARVLLAAGTGRLAERVEAGDPVPPRRRGLRVGIAGEDGQHCHLGPRPRRARDRRAQREGGVVEVRRDDEDEPLEAAAHRPTSGL